MKLTTNYGLTNQCITVCNQISPGSFKNVIYKLWVNKSYIFIKSIWH